MKKSQRGFSAVEVLLILIVMGIVGFAGWYVYHTRSNSTAATSADITNLGQRKQNNSPAPSQLVLQKDYKVYASTTYGFSYAYPNSWGDLSPSANQTTGWFVATTADLGKLPFGQSVLSGTNSFSVHSVDGYTIVANKYGATVKPVNVNGAYSWVVTDVNPADTTDKPGDTYKVTSFINTNGATLYDFTWEDEGGTHGRWVFVAKGNIVTLELADIWTLASQRLCEKASGATLSQASEHDAAHGEVNPGFFTAGKDFVVLGESTPGGKPGERALDDPAPCEHVEATGADLFPLDLNFLRHPHTADAAPRMLHDLDLPAKGGFDPLAEAAFLVSTLGPDQLQTGETASKRLQQEFATVVILDVGLMHQHLQQESIGIDKDMALAPSHACAAIVAAPPPF
jgi:hypothetical protein